MRFYGFADGFAWNVSALRREQIRGRDQPGISQATRAQPRQVALVSAASFAVGPVLPLAVAALTPESSLIGWAAPKAGSTIS